MSQAFEWKSSSDGLVGVNGGQIEYCCWGPKPGDAPTVVLLHEGLGSAKLWRDFPEKLAEATGWGVFSWSRTGHGQSDIADLPLPINFMTIEATQVLPDLLDAIEFQYGVLLGHSDGATISAIYIGSVEDHRVRGLILMAPHFFTESMGLEEITRSRIAFTEGDLRERMSRHHKNPDNTFNGWCDTWLNPGFKTWDVTEVIDYMRIPVLAIQGRNDQYGTLAQVRVVEERSYAPVDIEVIEECRHSPHLDQPEKTLSLVTEYLERLQRIETDGLPEL